MRISSIISRKTPLNAKANNITFQRYDCRKPHKSSLDENDVFIRMAEASLSGTTRGQAIQNELQSMNLI